MQSRNITSGLSGYTSNFLCLMKITKLKFYIFSVKNGLVGTSNVLQGIDVFSSVYQNKCFVSICLYENECAKIGPDSFPCAQLCSCS